MPSVEIARSNSTSSEDDKITPVDKLDSSYQLESAGEEPVKRHWFRSTAFQAIVTGSCSLLSPGLWNAVNATGGGGAQEPFLVNAGNALVFGLMVFFCFGGSVVSNKIGLKYTLLVGTLGYLPYSVGLYENKVRGTIWVVLFGAALCGISAGLFWAVEGAISLGYPEARKRGVYLAIWLGFKSMGQILGGSINLGLNVATKGTGSVSSSTYLVFIALQALAPIIALLLSEPHKVQRSDGTKVTVGTSKLGFWAEIKEVCKVLIRKEVLLLLPMAFYSSLHGPYTSTFLSLHFSVRARALASLVVALLGISMNFVFGCFVDTQRLSLKTRARGSYLFLTLLALLTWIWGLVLQIEFSKKTTTTKYDWVDPGFARAWTCYLLWAMNTALIQNALYWYIGCISRDGKDIGRLSGCLRSIESLGSCVGYGMNSKKTMNQIIPLSIDVAFFGASTLICWPTINRIGVDLWGGNKRPDEHLDSSARSSTTEVDRAAIEKTLHVKGEASTGLQ